MPTFEEELQRFDRFIRLVSGVSLLGKKVIVCGEENFVKDGPNIIVGNHCGSFKDVATVFRIVPRPVFFTANRQIFDQRELNRLVRKHLHRHVGNIGVLLNFLLLPFKRLFVTYVSSNIAKIGTIPVDLDNHGKREAIERCQEYLKAGRVVVALQGRGRVVPGDPNPYVKAFGLGISIVAANLRDRYGISVPVTPVAFYGTQLPFLIPGKILVNVGKPMHIEAYIGGSFEESVARFKDALEAAVNKLFLELIRPQGA
ncbi:MAG: lysophospholipid acyltransferase family protein [Candidatus Aminicenantales bacterium]